MTMAPSTSVPPPNLFADPNQRRAVIDRIVRFTQLREAIAEGGTPIRVNKGYAPLEIQYYDQNDKDYAINPPYGLTGLAWSASPEQLAEMVAYCERKKREFTRRGDYIKAQLFGNRQDMIKGILTHATKYQLL